MNAQKTLFVNSSSVNAAVVVVDGRIAAAGSTEAVLKYRDAKTRVVDLDGGYLYPGFIESHAHILSTGQQGRMIDLSDCKSVVDLETKLNEWKRPNQNWILGRGWDQTKWVDGQFPTLAGLKSKIKSPFYLTRVDGHAAFANEEALKRAGISETTKDPDGGLIVRDSSGKPTGLLVDTAMFLVEACLPPPSITERKDMILDAQALFHSQGVTSCHDPGVSLDEFDAFCELDKENRLKLRSYAMFYGQNFETALGFLKSQEPRSVSEHLSLRAIKLFADGALGSRGAAFFAPYCDDPKNAGLLLWKQNELEEVCQMAFEKGFQVCVHAIGDRANRMVLDAFEKALQGNKAARWRIEHAQSIDPADLPRFAHLGVIASQQPLHCTSDMRFAQARLGEARCQKGAYAWRSLMDCGAHVCFGSDSPIERPSVIGGIHAAVTRQNESGEPPGGWYPAECLSRKQALEAFTINGAWAAFEEKNLGSLEPGKSADMVVVSQDLETCEDLLKTKVLRTVVGGETVYKA